MSLKGVLVDVQRLSQERCNHPLQGKLAYATSQNFLGRVVAGYDANATDIFLLTAEAANAVCEAQNALHAKGLGLYIFDAYRPLRAVQDFARWFNSPPDAAEKIRQLDYYPRFSKQALKTLGYIADPISNHNFGHTIDLTLQSLQTGQCLDLGAPFDFFDPLAHTTAQPPEISQQAYENRQCLAQAMIQAGFQPFEQEYWHFTYHHQSILEPLDLPILPQYKGI